MVKKVDNNEFQNFYWIGGAACGGKSTLATLLSEKYDYTLYKCDQHFHTRKTNSNPKHSPLLYDLPARPLEDVLLNIPLERQVEEYIAFLSEDFELLIEDLKKVPRNKPVIVEGNQLLPHLLPQHISNLERAIWITPTTEFYNKNFFNRKWILEKVQTCSNPKQALENWVGRSTLFTQWIDKTTIEGGLTLFKTPLGIDLQSRAEQIEKHFRLL